MGEKCQYENCQNDATTHGFVFEWKNGKRVPIGVIACDEHKKLSGFLEYK